MNSPSRPSPPDPSTPRGQPGDADALAAHRAQESLRLQLAAAVELGCIATWHRDLQNDVLHFNRVGAEFLGLADDRSHLTLPEMLDLVHPDDRAQLRESAVRMLRGEVPEEFEVRVLSAHTRTWRHLRSRRVVERDAEGRAVAVHGASVDLTAAREDERRASVMVSRLEKLGPAAGLGYWIVTHWPNKIFWGRQLYAMHGLDPDSEPPSLHRWLRRHVHPQDRRAVWQTVRAWLSERRPAHEMSFRLLRADGGVLDVTAHSRFDLEGGRVKPYGLLADVTEHRAAQAAVRRSAEQAQLVARTLGLGTWEQDLITGEVQWDDQMWRLRGMEPQRQPTDAAYRESFVHPEDLRALNALRDRGLHETGPLEYEFRVVWPDGSTRWLTSRSISEIDSAGQPTRRIGLNWDTTEARSLRQAAQERQVAQRELQAKSQFLSRMSHELRTPLNAVLGFTQLLQADESPLDTATQRARLEQIHAAGRHLLALIDDVLDLSRLEGGEMTVALEPVDVLDAVRTALPMVEGMAHEYGVSLQLGPLEGRVMADPTRLRQVLVNLLTNAIKYNRRGGRVTIDANCADGVALLRVSDTGRGMSEAQRRHLFEPFNRLGAERGTVEGTGIGLAIVKMLVERMEGTVHVQSVAGEGSCFELRLRDGHGLPLVPQIPAHAHMMALAAITAGRRTRGRILYVEDNPVNAMILKQLVAHRSDLTLCTAENGLEGLDVARRWGPDLVLLDMQLPDIDGMEIFSRLRADPRCADIPCIALSANAMPADIQAALNAGFADYWTKPLDFALFHAALNTFFGEQAASAQSAGAPTSSTNPR